MRYAILLALLLTACSPSNRNDTVEDMDDQCPKDSTGLSFEQTVIIGN
jgi:hypothetical protein